MIPFFWASRCDLSFVHFCCSTRNCLTFNLHHFIINFYYQNLKNPKPIPKIIGWGIEWKRIFQFINWICGCFFIKPKAKKNIFELVLCYLKATISATCDWWGGEGERQSIEKSNRIDTREGKIDYCLSVSCFSSFAGQSDN